MAARCPHRSRCPHCLRCPPATTHLLVQPQRIDLRQHPPHAAIATAHQDAESGELLEEAQPGKRGQRGLWGPTGLLQVTPTYQHSPQVWASIHEVEDLGRVEELLEFAQELDALVVPTLGVDESQEGTGAGGGTGGLPEPCEDTRT